MMEVTLSIIASLLGTMFISAVTVMLAACSDENTIFDKIIDALTYLLYIQIVALTASCVVWAISSLL